MMNRVFISCILILICLNTTAQSFKIDSLHKLLSKAASDTQRINLINKIGDVYSQINLDSSLAYAKLAQAASEKAGYISGEIDAMQGLALNYSYKGLFTEAKKNLVLAEDKSLKAGDSMALVNLYSTFGVHYAIQGIYDTALIYYKKLLPIAERNAYREKLKTVYNNIGIAYQMQSNFSDALAYFQKGLRESEKDNDINNQAYLLLNMGITLIALNDNLTAKNNFLKAIEFAKKDGAEIVELYAYSNIASVFSGLKHYDSAYFYAMKAVKLGEKTADSGMVITNMARAARQLADLSRFEEAEALANKALQLTTKVPNYNINQVNTDMAYIKVIQGKYAEAILFFEKAFNVMGNNIVYTSYTGLAYAHWSLSYEKTGDYKKALEMFKKSVAISDSVKSRDNVRKSTEMLMNYEFETKQQIAKAKQDKKTAELNRIKNLQYFASGLFLLLAIFMFVNYRQKSKAKDKIEKAYSQLQSTQAQLIQSEKMASLGELTAGIAHEIQNPLNFVNNFSEVSNEMIEELKDEIKKANYGEVTILADDIKQNLEKINHHGKRADAIVKGMLQHSRKSEGQKEPTDINALCDEYLRLSYHGLRAKDKSFNATLKTDFDDTIGKVNIIPQDIGRVMMNLITNAFYAVNEKHIASQHQLNQANYEPTISISTKKLSDKIEIKVADNGNGIPQNIIDKIFQPFFTTKPTGQGTGLGLSLAYDIIKAHGGVINVTTEKDQGTTFSIHLSAV